MPIFEPSNQQEAYDMVYNAFDFSEKHKIPVLLRITTRLAHSRAGISRSPQKEQNENSLPPNPQQFVLLPSIARGNYETLVKNQVTFEKEAETSKYNTYTEGKDKSKGIIAAGISLNYLLENYENSEVPYPVLKIGQYPAPAKLIQKIYDECDEVFVLEDGYPFLEKKLKSVLGNTKIKGRLDEDCLPRTGELNPNHVAYALGLEDKIIENIPEVIESRPPALCAGCGHTDVFTSLNEVMLEHGVGKVFADIGCYTLSALPPLKAINTCVDMGASITMAKGASDAGLRPAIAFIGDSTFTHSGMTGLLDCIIEKTPITIIISDNSTTGMTGGQDSHALNRLHDICLGLGVEKEHLRSYVPLRKNHEESLRIIREEIAYEGVSVIIPVRECVRTLEKKIKLKKLKH